MINEFFFAPCVHALLVVGRRVYFSHVLFSFLFLLNLHCILIYIYTPSCHVSEGLRAR